MSFLLFHSQMLSKDLIKIIVELCLDVKNILLRDIIMYYIYPSFVRLSVFFGALLQSQHYIIPFKLYCMISFYHVLSKVNRKINHVSKQQHFQGFLYI